MALKSWGMGYVSVAIHEQKSLFRKLGGHAEGGGGIAHALPGALDGGRGYGVGGGEC